MSILRESDDRATIDRMAAFLKRNGRRAAVVTADGEATYHLLSPVVLLENAKADADNLRITVGHMEAERQSVIDWLASQSFNFKQLIDGGMDLLEAVSGEVLTWNALLDALARAWPEGQMPGYSQSPMELLYQIINQRDELLVSLEEARAGDLSRDATVTALSGEAAGLRLALQQAQYARVDADGIRRCIGCGHDRGHAPECFVNNQLAANAGAALASEVDELRQSKAATSSYQSILAGVGEAIDAIHQQPTGTTLPVELEEAVVALGASLVEAQGEREAKQELQAVVDGVAQSLTGEDGQVPPVDMLPLAVAALAQSVPLARAVCAAKVRLANAVVEQDDLAVERAVREEAKAFKLWCESQIPVV